jgi:glycosyltransferase involved in cell wall biosynthesis/GT2 family glycosyltransferase
VIDVIVPVHGGCEATRRCLDSVLASRVQAAHEVVVVNDGKPEPELARHLAELAARRRITLLEHPSPHGLAAGLNQAVALHPDRDVAILHSDAEVAHDWLDRLAAHARAPGVGAVAPFTSATGAATYPLPDAANALPEGHDVASLDALFARVNAGEHIDLPELGGPCLYVRRECLAAAGSFDAAPLGSDYAVLTEFCLRAAIAGFRLRLAGDVFVGHAGHASFGAAADTLRARSVEALQRLYPGYAAQREAMRADDAPRPLRRRVDLARLAAIGRPLLVFVSHGWGGGIRRHMTDLAALVGERAVVLFLEPSHGDTVRLHWPRDGEGFEAFFDLPGDLPRLAAMLRGLGLARVHFHHVHRLPRAILELPAAAGVPYDCTLHDYYAICPQYHLADASGRYCGEPDDPACMRCLEQRPAQWGMDIATWRATLGAWLRGAARVIAPSHDVARRIGRYLPDVPVSVWPHPEAPTRPAPRMVRVAVLGNLSPEKGLHVVAACAKDAGARRLPLAFRVLGTTAEPLPRWPDAPLTLHGQYDEHELPRLLAAEKPDVIWFPAQVPETYSYTLSVALATGLPLVVSALGALPERTAGHPRVLVLPFDAAAPEWNAALLASVAPERAAEPRAVLDRVFAS